jgi:peptide/nickel transport system substrate-binding protein
LENLGKLDFSIHTSNGWDLVAFGIDSLGEDGFAPFAVKEVRQAVAMCIDRQSIVDTFFMGETLIPDTYVPPTHPLNNPEVHRYEFDPEEAASIFNEAGWLDHDQNPQTPRIASGVPDVLDGTPLEFEYHVPNGAERPEVANMIQSSLGQCGVKVEIFLEDWESLFESGPEGPIFGRRFDMVNLAWVTSVEPTCHLYTSDQVPGPFPDYKFGWGGGNLTGYQNTDFDENCSLAKHSIPGQEVYLEAHQQAQLIFADDVPVLPLYQRIALNAMRVDMCDISSDLTATNAVNYIEIFDYGSSCGR